MPARDPILPVPTPVEATFCTVTHVTAVEIERVRDEYLLAARATLLDTLFRIEREIAARGDTAVVRDMVA